MDNLLLKIAGVIFLLSLTVTMIRMFFTRGSKFKALTYLTVYGAILFSFARLINISSPITFGSSVAEVQAIELQAVEFKDYLADSKQAYTLALQALADGDCLQAIEMLSLVIPGDPNFNDAQSRLAEAKKVYAEQLADKGRKAMLAGKLDQAVQWFDESLTYNPDLAEVKGLRLDALARQQVSLEAKAAQQTAQELKQARQQMGQYEFGTDKLGVSVKKMKVTEVIPTDLGFSYTSRGDEHFLWVYVSVINQGESAVRVSPENFYISGDGASRAARSEATYSQVHLPEMKIRPGLTTEGWVIFYVAGQKQYTLHYYNDGVGIDKVIVL